MKEITPIGMFREGLVCGAIIGFCVGTIVSLLILAAIGLL